MSSKDDQQILLPLKKAFNREDGTPTFLESCKDGPAVCSVVWPMQQKMLEIFVDTTAGAVTVVQERRLSELATRAHIISPLAMEGGVRS